MRGLSFTCALVIVLCGTFVSGQAQLTVTTNCHGNTATAPLLSIYHDPCSCVAGNATIATCASCAMTIVNTHNQPLTVRMRPMSSGAGQPGATPGLGEGQAGLDANSTVTLNPISLGIPVGEYYLWVICPCTGEWVAAGKMYIRNC